MLSDEQYNKLLPYRGSIFAQSISGAGVADILHSVYTELGNAPVNLYCSACGGDMLAELKRKIQEYENKKK